MRLCFGVFATVLKMASSSVSNMKIVTDLISTIDPAHLLESPDTVSKLINCKNSFADKETVDGSGAIRKSGALTVAVPLSYTADPNELAVKFESDIIPILSEDRKAALIGALQHIIQNDDSLRHENTLTFEKCMGMELRFVLSTNLEISLPRFLAGIFLYTLRTNENSLPECRETLAVVKKADFFEQFSGYLITYSNEAIKGFTPAPDHYASYLAKLKNKYEMITPLIYRGVPHPFYDTYVSGTVSWNDQVEDNLDIAGLLKISRSVIFTGTGGQGKSMLMRHLLLDAVAHYDDTRLVPVFISVKDFDGRIPDILQCAHAFIRNLWPELSMDELQTIFIDGKAILLFDGLDEIRPNLLSVFTASLNDFLDRYPGNAIILSSRPYGNFASFSRFTPVNLNPFTVDQAVSLISKLEYPAGQPEVNREFQELLRSGLYESHRGLADNPLLLSIMLMTYATYHEVPTEAYRLLEMAYSVLAKLHDDSKDNFTRNFATGWSVDTFADRFAYFCTITYREGETTFSRDTMAKYFSKVRNHYRESSVDVSQFITDLCTNICLMTDDLGSYAFIHRSFQEYFTARFLYMQDARQLKKVIPVFDRMDETRRDDRTLLMLYDMEPDAVQEHIFLPYLEKLVESCSGSDGIWVFLKKLYSHLDCADGDQRAKHPDPDSLLYDTICRIYGIQHAILDPGAYPVLNHDSLNIYVRNEDTGESVSIRRLPPEYLEQHAEPLITGRVYQFDWGALEQSEAGRTAVTEASGPFISELNEIRRLYDQLKAVAPAADDSDPFEDMF